MSKITFQKKSDLCEIKLNENVVLPDLKNIYEAKFIVVAKWLKSYIENGLKSGEFQINNILPSKSDFAYKLGVSMGTMQNAFRYLEDLGYVESKQCIGTIIRDFRNPDKTLRKLTSKRDLAIEEIKRYLLTGGFKIGSMLPSATTIATIIGFGTNTTRLALENLVTNNILEHKYTNDSGLIIKSLDIDLNKINIKQKTLVDIAVADIEKYISENLNVGDKIPPHTELAAMLKVSIKTINDSLKILAEKGIIFPRRGQYGTVVMSMPADMMNKTKNAVRSEMSIFAPAKDTAFYHYEKIQNRIKKMIVSDYEIGDKLPSIMELSKKMDISPNTIRKAFSNLSKEGYLVFSRGRYGGTFVIDIPEIETQTFKWIAVNPQYAKDVENV